MRHFIVISAFLSLIAPGCYGWQVAQVPEPTSIAATKAAGEPTKQNLEISDTLGLDVELALRPARGLKPLAPNRLLMIGEDGLLRTVEGEPTTCIGADGHTVPCLIGSSGDVTAATPAQGVATGTSQSNARARGRNAGALKSDAATGRGPQGQAASRANALSTQLSATAPIVACTDTGKVNSILCTVPNVVTAYTAGMTVYVIPAAGNTGSVTINVNGLGSVPVTKNGPAALSGGELLTGALAQLQYDGTRFQVLNGSQGWIDNGSVLTTLPGRIVELGTTVLPASTPISVLAYGADPTGTNDSYSAIASAIAAATAAGRTVLFPSTASGVIYSTSQAISIPSNVVAICDPGVTIKARPSSWWASNTLIGTSYTIGVPTGANVQVASGIQGCKADANSVATNAIYVYQINYQTGLSNVWGLHSVGDAIVVQDSEGGQFENLRASAAGGNGITFVGTNAAKVFGINTTDNTLDGLNIQEDSGGPMTGYVRGNAAGGGGEYFGVHSESNGRNGVNVVNTADPTKLFNGWIELNTGDGVRITSASVVVTGMRISGAGSGSNYGVNVVGTMPGMYIVGNHISNSSGNANYAVVNTTGAASGIFSPNYSITGSLLSSSLNFSTTETLQNYSNRLYVPGVFWTGSLGTGGGPTSDFYTAPSLKTVYVGKQSSTSGDNSVFIVQNRVGTPLLKGDTNGVGTLTLGLGNSSVVKLNTTNTTGAMAASLGSNCPAVTCTSPYTWITLQSADGSTVYMPVFK